MGLGDALQFPKEDLTGVVWLLQEIEVSSVRRMCGGTAPDHHGHLATATLPVSKWSCLLLRIVLQDALSEVTKIYPPLKLRVLVDDITALLMWKRKWQKWHRR